MWAKLPPSQVIGCVVYPAAEVIRPGVIEHTYGDRFSLGEPDGARSRARGSVVGDDAASGLKAPVRPRIRDELWVKLWGNLALNPLSALTSTTLDRLAGESDLRAIARTMMLEAKTVGEALGVRFAIDVEKRIDGAGEVGAHKTSMLQDLERGRPLEIDALLGAVVELGTLTGQRNAPVPRGAGARPRACPPGRRLLVRRPLGQHRTPAGKPTVTMATTAVANRSRFRGCGVRRLCRHVANRSARVWRYWMAELRWGRKWFPVVYPRSPASVAAFLRRQSWQCMSRFSVESLVSVETDRTPRPGRHD